MNQRATVLALALASGLVFASGANAGGRPDLVEAGLLNPQVRYVPSELLVQFRSGHAEAARQSVLERIGARLVSTLRSDAKGSLQQVRLPKGVALLDAIRAIKDDASVDFVEPNWLYTRQATLNPDPYYADGSLWGMYGDNSRLQTNPYGSQAAEA